MTWKTVNNSDAGTATVFGGNDLDKISNLLNGVSNVDTVTINSSWTFQNGKLTIQGNLFGRVAKTANYSLVVGDSIVEADCNAGSFTLTLPTAVSVAGQTYLIKRADSGTGGLTNILTVATTSSQTIDKATQWILKTRLEEVVIYSDGTNWQVLSYTIPDIFTIAKGSTRNKVYSTPIGTSGTITTATVVAGTLLAMFFVVTKTTTFDQISVVSTTGGAGSSVRMAIYADGGDGYPGALIAGSDVGALSSAGTGVLTNTFATAITLQPGIYWLAFNCSATAPVVSGFTLADVANFLGYNLLNPPTKGGIGWTVALAFGAMPATFTAGGTVITALPYPYVFLRAIS